MELEEWEKLLLGYSTLLKEANDMKNNQSLAQQLKQMI